MAARPEHLAKSTGAEAPSRPAGGPAGEDEDELSVASALREVMPLFVHGEDFKVLSLVLDDVAELNAEPSFSCGAPRLVAWSPDGALLAVVDPVEGLLSVDFASGEPTCVPLSASVTAAQHLQWSPKGSYLVVQQSPSKAESDEPNVQAWKRASDNTLSPDASFVNPKVKRDLAMFQWSPDEKICCRILADGTLQFFDGVDLKHLLLESPVAVLGGVQACRFAPCSALGDSLCAFTTDTRDSLQCVVKPAMAHIFKPWMERPDFKPRTVDIEFGQEADLKWSPTGTAVLAHCQTDIDDSGQSYYGGSKLVLLSRLETYKLDLTEAKDSVVQAVEWCPARDEFALIQGFQPAKTTLWSWDPQALKCTLTATLHDSAHRNTVRWNPFGSLVCIAGFGNLAGQMTFFGRTEKGLQKVSDCTAACSVSAEWAPDGRHFMTASLAPRMRVDNGLLVWSALSGSKVAKLELDPLYEVQWQPELRGGGRFLDIGCAEVEHVLSGTAGNFAGGAKKQAYRPPTGRGTANNTVAMMMKGELGGETKSEVQLPRKLLEDDWPREEKSTQPALGHGAGLCPRTGWEYMDPKGRKQGPFTLEQMTQWHRMGVFKGTLQVRYDPNDRFVPLQELFPHPMVPFLRAPKRTS